MQRLGRRLPALTGFMVIVALLAAFGLVSEVRAQDGDDDDDNDLASITIYTTICPTNYTGTAYFDDCYDNPGDNITFILDESATAATGADGFTAFEGLDAEGEYLLQIDVPGEFTDFVAYCSDEFGDPFEFTSAADIGGILLDLTLDDDIRCDFYIIPISGREPPAPTRAPATSTVGSLPSTGAGPTGGDRSALVSLVGALTLLVVAGVAFGRFRLASADVRARR